MHTKGYFFTFLHNALKKDCFKERGWVCKEMLMTLKPLIVDLDVAYILGPPLRAPYPFRLIQIRWAAA